METKTKIKISSLLMIVLLALMMSTTVVFGWMLYSQSNAVEVPVSDQIKFKMELKIADSDDKFTLVPPNAVITDDSFEKTEIVFHLALTLETTIHGTTDDTIVNFKLNHSLVDPLNVFTRVEGEEGIYNIDKIHSYKIKERRIEGTDTYKPMNLEFLVRFTRDLTSEDSFEDYAQSLMFTMSWVELIK